MASESVKWQLLESCPVADEADWLRHAAAFTAVFVAPARRPRRIGSDSHKLHTDLDRRTCRRVDELPAAVRGSGVFYQFSDVPREVPAASVAVAVGGSDAIFSLVPGKLAVFFFHEGEVWLCQA